MATIQKSTKINFYKFVQVKDPSGGDGANASVKAIHKNTIAVNNLGATVNSIGKILGDLKKIQLARLDASTATRKDFDAQYTKAKKQKKKTGGSIGEMFKTPSFIEGLMKMLGGLLKVAIIIPALKWLGDPANREKVKNIIDAISKLVTFIFDVAKFGVVNTIEGLYTLLSDDSSPWERIGGLVRGLTGLGTLLLGLRWLANPTRIITDFGNVLIFFRNNLIKGRRGLLGRGLALGLAAAGTFAGVKAYNYLKDGETTATEVEDGQEPANKPEGFSKGGKVNLLPQRASGGFINGPQSGYPVSLDGGRSTSFIGHGREYVARKANGGAFVGPLNAPGTKTQPHLTSRRMGEAKSQGFDIGGMVNGFQGGFNPGKGFKEPKSQNVMPSFAPESKFMSQGGGLPSFSNGGNLNKQIYLHWTASRHNWKAGPYHTTVQGDGTLYKHLPYDRHGAHTYYRNTGNVGLSIAAMKDWNWESYGPTKPQLDGLMGEAAVVAKGWGWKPSDVTVKRVMTHAEAASNKDGRSPHDNYGPQFWNGTGERSDLHKLSRNEKDGTGGDKLRQMMKKFMGMSNPPLLKEVGPGAGANGGGAQKAGAMNSSEYALLQRLVLAEAGGEGKIGMSLVARSVLNRAGLIQSGKVGPGMFMANDKSVTGVIMGRHQYEPVSSGSINDSRSAAQMQSAKEAIEMARNPANLRGTLEAEGLQAAQINYLMASTGFRTGSAFNDPSQNVNVVKYKNHFFNTAGNKDVKHSLAEIENGGTGGGYGAGDYGPSTGNGGTGSSFDMDSGKPRAPLSPKAKSIIASITGGKASSATGLRIGAGGNSAPESKFLPPTGTNQSSIQSQTDERNNARNTITEKSQQMIQTALSAIAQQNGVNSQAILAAKQAVQVAMSSSNNNQPMMVGGGSSPTKSIASTLQSTLNPLRGILK